MRRVGWAWLVFGLCVALAAGAMTRLGASARDLERAENRARRQAALEENLQLALWRMDSALAPLIAEESARPYFSYSPLYPAERAFTNMFAEIQKGDVLVPSPLLTFSTPHVRIHFQYGPDNRLSSPQVPAGNMRDLAESRCLTSEAVESASRRLDELGALVSRRDLSAALVDEGPSAPDVVNPSFTFAPTPESKSTAEYAMRSRSAKNAQSAVLPQTKTPPTRSTVWQGPLQAVWVGRALLLARRVRVEEGTFLQGCWLDWDAIRRDLLAGVDDLLPASRLEPVDSLSGQAPSRMLASMPARLVPGTLPAWPDDGWSPVRLSLAIAWGCLGVAAAAVGLLLQGALGLSERRGTFVSAVTHELRTPLTTFRLYTEMLDEGMVSDEAARRSYFKTLRAEADRLGHLVENVLAFARLERGRASDGRELIAPSELLDRLTPRLDLRARQAGMELLVGSAETERPVSVDPTVVDQILSNLLDNAIKYAGGDDRRILFDLAPAGRWLRLTVRDHGPGLPPKAVRRLFRPFSKSAHDAAHSAPGVGLGLALSRRLARSLGGDLRLTENGPRGACFSLTLPYP